MYRWKIPAQSVLYEKTLNSDKYIVLHRWGTSSSKTYSNIGVIVTWLTTGKIANSYKDDTTGKVVLDEKGNKKPLILSKWLCHIYRKTKEALRWSVQRDLENTIKNTFLIDEKWEVVKKSNGVEITLWDYLNVNKTNRSYEYQWRIIELNGADDEEKLRGPRRDITYINEATELSEDEFMQIDLRTKYKLLMDFNPSDEDHWVNNQVEIQRVPAMWDVEVIVSTHWDNPFLMKRQRDVIESLKWRNPKAYLVYGKWEYGKVEGLVFKNWEVIDEIPEEARFLWNWLDFWFTNDPSALIYVAMIDTTIYLHELIYRTWLTNQDIADEAMSLWVSESDEIIADSAEPKSIEEIYRRWLRGIKPAVKWKDSHMYGIGIMENYTYCITKSSVNIIKEFKKFCWLQDKNGKWLNETIWDWNHAIDAVKYVMAKKLKSILPEKKKKKRILWR